MEHKNNPTLTPRARQLRKTMTKEERKLWYDFLRAYPLHIYRQRTIGKYIADFYCPAASLVIELDGSQHCEPAAQSYDAARTAYLASLGLHVLRIPNNALTQNFPATCDYIDAVIKKRLKKK